MQPPKKNGRAEPPPPLPHPMEWTASCLSFALRSLKQTLKMTNVQRRISGSQIPRASQTLKKPPGFNLHMVPSPEIHPGLHYLELTSLHHSVDN